jgi:hypothetical protein
MLTMSAKTKRDETNRTTVTLPADLNEEAAKLVSETGVSLSDLCRQGLVRMILERRETGNVRLLPLPALQAA